MTHTKGPWVVDKQYEDDGGLSKYIRTEDHAVVVSMFSGVSNDDLAIILAAPELLASCIAMMGYMDSGVLIRDTANDSEPGWHLKMLSFVKDLQVMSEAVARATKAGA